MPTYLPPRLGISQSRAYAEAAAFAKAGEPVLLTLAIYHPLITDPTTEQQIGVYIVNDFEPLRATLEDDAPLDGGAEVTFRPVPMRIRLPDESSDAPAGTVEIEISNVSRELVPYLEAAAASADPIELMFRTYLPSDTGGPHETPPLRVQVTGATVTTTAVSLTASFGDTTNRRFPRLEYTPEDFPCLAP
jgi:hypothetical protein